jgi:hypothetical protein
MKSSNRWAVMKDLESDDEIIASFSQKQKNDGLLLER